MLYLKRRCECLLDARVYWRFGYSDLKEAALPEAALMGFLCSPGVLGGVVQVLFLVDKRLRLTQRGCWLCVVGHRAELPATSARSAPRLHRSDLYRRACRCWR